MTKEILNKYNVKELKSLIREYNLNLRIKLTQPKENLINDLLKHITIDEKHMITLLNHNIINPKNTKKLVINNEIVKKEKSGKISVEKEKSGKIIVKKMVQKKINKKETVKGNDKLNTASFSMIEIEDKEKKRREKTIMDYNKKLISDVAKKNKKKIIKESEELMDNLQEYIDTEYDKYKKNPQNKILNLDSITKENIIFFHDKSKKINGILRDTYKHIINNDIEDINELKKEFKDLKELIILIQNDVLFHTNKYGKPLYDYYIGYDK